MKKGLNVTLMTVAIVVMAFQVMAKAPTITDIKDPIVGNEPGATSSTPFVYPDAFDITAKASDDTTQPAFIRWSYSYSGTEVYRINNVDRVLVNDASITNPIASQKINGATKDPGDGDNNSATITIRNVKYAPIPPATGTTPSTTGIIDAVPVTLFASDGTTYSSETVMFYTDNGGNDRLSPAGPGWVPEGPGHLTTFPTQGTITWGWVSQAGAITASTNAGGAVCIETALAGINLAYWESSMGMISVAKNTIYRIRARIQGTNTSPETTPFFDFVLGNYNGTTGFNMFGADWMFLDNEGGANAPLLKTATNGTTYEMYWTPACVSSDAFNNNTSIWAANAAEYRKMSLTFRVMDLSNSAAITANNDFGRLCLNDLTVDALPIGSMTTQQVWASPAAPTASTFHAGSFFGKTTYQSDKVLLERQTTGGINSKDVDFGGAFPGDNVLGNYSTPAELAKLADEYPIPWESNTVYKVTFKYSAVDAASEAAPFDAIWVGMDCPSNEFIMNSYVTSQGGIGVNPAMPKAGAAQDYVAYVYSHTRTTSSHPEFRFLRPRSEWANAPGMTESPNTGSVYLHGATVSKVTF